MDALEARKLAEERVKEITWYQIDSRIKRMINDKVQSGDFELHCNLLKSDIEKLQYLGFKIEYQSQYNDYIISW